METKLKISKKFHNGKNFRSVVFFLEREGEVKMLPDFLGEVKQEVSGDGVVPSCLFSFIPVRLLDEVMIKAIVDAMNEAWAYVHVWNQDVGKNAGNVFLG